jgi:hypothetical protein
MHFLGLDTQIKITIFCSVKTLTTLFIFQAAMSNSAMVKGFKILSTKLQGVVSLTLNNLMSIAALINLINEANRLEIFK